MAEPWRLAGQTSQCFSLSETITAHHLVENASLSGKLVLQP
jgi:hypothetical protein